MSSRPSCSRRSEPSCPSSTITQVADFNLSKITINAASSSAGNGTLANNNPRWLAPEVLKGGKATVASDIYAFGIVLWELMTWRLPWEREESYRILYLVMEGDRPAVLPAAELPGGGGFPGLGAYVALMQSCWEQDARRRPASFAAVILALQAMS